MIQKIIEENKAATRYLSLITYSGLTDRSLPLSYTHSLDKTISDLKEAMQLPGITDEEIKMAKVAIETYEHLKTNFCKIKK